MTLRETILRRAKELVDRGGMDRERAVAHAKREVRDRGRQLERERQPDPQQEDDSRAMLRRAQSLATMGPPIRGATLDPVTEPQTMDQVARLGGELPEGEDQRRIEDLATMDLGFDDGDDDADGDSYGLDFGGGL